MSDTGRSSDPVEPHLVRIVIDKGEMTYGRMEIICPGGADCAPAVIVRGCVDVESDRRDHIALRLQQGYSEAQAIDEWHEDAEYIATTCDGFWWEGDHLHRGEPGSGCDWQDWLAGSGQEMFELSEPLSFEVPVRFSGHYEDGFTITPSTEDQPTEDAS